MSLFTTAGTAQKKIATYSEINDITEQLLLDINNDIDSAVIDGKSSVVVDLPIYYTVSNMTNSEALSNVLYKIITRLERRKFIVRYEVLEHKIAVYISWVNPSSTLEQLKINSILRSHIISTKEKIDLLKNS